MSSKRNILSTFKQNTSCTQRNEHLHDTTEHQVLAEQTTTCKGKFLCTQKITDSMLAGYIIQTLAGSSNDTQETMLTENVEKERNWVIIEDA